MSEQTPRSMRDYTKFDQMSTEELQEFLRADMLLPEDELPDLDAVLYVTDVLARRAQEQTEEAPTDVEAAWQSFCTHYWPETDDGASLYEDVPEEPCRKHAQKRTRSHTWRSFAAVAAVIAVLYVGAMTARAFGFNIFNSVAEWSQETFSLTPFVKPPKGTVASQLLEMQNLMEEHEVSETYLPSYLPAGFVVDGVDCHVWGSGLTTFSCELRNGKQRIRLKYDVYLTDETRHNTIYEKDTADPELYEAGGVTHYLMTNHGEYIAVWNVDHMDCSIIGSITRGEMIKIINSIY